MNIYWVCLYGMLDPDRRTEIEMRGYEAYLKACAARIEKDAKSGINPCIILSGGRTTELPTSEAQSVLPFFTSHLRHSAIGTRHIILDEESLDSIQHIKRLKEYIRVHGGSHITIMSDSLRALKMRVLAWRILSDTGIPFEVVGFPREDIHPSSNRRTQTLAALKYLFVKV